MLSLSVRPTVVRVFQKNASFSIIFTLVTVAEEEEAGRMGPIQAELDSF